MRATYPLPAGLAAAVIGTCSKYRKTGITDVFLALDWLMREGKVIKDPGDGLLPDRYYERPGEERFEEWKKQVKKNTGADA